MQLTNPFDAIITKLDYLQNTVEEIKSSQPTKKSETGNDEKELINLQQASLLLNMPVSTIHFHKANHQLPFLKPGKRLLFRKSELLTWLDKFSSIGSTDSTAIDRMRKSRKKGK
jgi:excisionase family DNA binding protein